MKPIAALLGALLRHMPVGFALVLLLYLAGFALMIFARTPGLILVTGVAVLFWHVMAGSTLRLLLRPETLLLPHFRRYLATTGAIDAMFCVALPVIAMTAESGWRDAPLAAAALLLVCAIGVASGAGMRALLLLWLPLIAVGWMPQFVFAAARDALTSPLLPLAMALAAALLLSLALRPLLIIRDREVDESPLQSLAGGRKSATDGTPFRRGAVGRKLATLLDGSAQRALDAALARYLRRHGAARRMALIRAALLPHDNATAVTISFVWVASIAALYFFATHAAQRWNAGYVGAYAVVIAISRFSAVGNGMLRMRPNLADLYMTLAPDTRGEFQATLADALLRLVGVAVVNCLAYAALIVALMHAHEPARLLLAAGIAGVGCAFGALAVHLVGPESPSGRAIVQLVIVAGAAGAYALTYWLLGRFGLGFGGVAALLPTLPFGLGAWHSARQQYLQRAPRFDVPLG